jgi:hypothetical protein
MRRGPTSPGGPILKPIHDKGAAHYETLLLGYGAVVNGTQNVVIYDGFSWGWNGLCGAAPEPATMLMLVCLGSGMAVARKLHRKKE